MTDTRERIKDIITSIAKEEPENVKAAVHDVIVAKFAAKANPELDPAALVDPDADPNADPNAE